MVRLLLLQVNCLDYMQGNMLLLPVKLISRLVLSSTTFAQHFIEAGGLMPSTCQRLLAESSPSPVLVDMLLVGVMLCRYLVPM